MQVKPGELIMIGSAAYQGGTWPLERSPFSQDEVATTWIPNGSLCLVIALVIINDFRICRRLFVSTRCRDTPVVGWFYDDAIRECHIV